MKIGNAAHFGHRVDLIEGDWSKLPKAWRPKELMFFSADIIGSTAIKQPLVPTEEGIIPDKSEWFADLQSFYINSAHLFREHYKRLFDKETLTYVRNMQIPMIWKTVGDQILFWVEITDTRQVFHYLECWRKAIIDLKERLGTGLNVKCAAWISHFSWRNKIIFTSPQALTGAEHDGEEDTNLQLMQSYFSSLADDEVDPANRLIPDFVGPGMDIGFRLADQASHRRFVVSTDVIYMLCRGLEYMGMHPKEIRMHFEGLQILKGVLGGLEYPIFWIDLADPADIYSYGSDLQKRNFCLPDPIIKFMNSFYHQRENYLYSPFIVSDTEEILTHCPRWYYDAHMTMVDLEAQRRA